MLRPRRLAPSLVVMALLWLMAPGTAFAAGDGGEASGRSAAQRLVEAYTPRLMLRAQEHPPCDTSEEQYEATTVETVLGNPTVKLTKLAPDGDEVLLKKAPSTADVAGRNENHHLNLHGEPLGDTCIYARDFAKLKREGKAPAVTYAHVAHEAGRPGLVVQYWFFWYFNQFNDLHEGDWEGMQIAFDASDPQRALEEGPRAVVLYQHAGGEKADWDDGKLEKEGTHPVVYPAAGSHATFYAAAVYVENGRKGSGVGCDNTTAPHTRLDVRPVQVPTHPSPNGRFRWLTYEGRWGQQEKGFNNGPTGPAAKDRWLEPLTWMEGVRSTSPRLPAGSVLGPTVTNAFCGAVAEVTSFLNRAQKTPWMLPAAIVAILLALALLVFGTSWGPVDLDRLRRRRAFGQLLHAAGRLYLRHWRTFAAIGLTAIPVVGGLTALSWLLTGGESGQRIDDSAGLSGLHVAVGELISGIGQPLAAAVMAAVTIVAVRLLTEAGRTGFRDSYRGMWRRFRRVVGAQLLGTLAVILMAVTVIGLPFAAWKYISWLFVQQEILFNDKSVREAFRGSSALVRGRWWYTLRVAVVLWLISVTTGPVLGFALIFTNLSLVLINAIGTLVFALLIPYVAIGGTLLYFDLQAEAEAAPAKRWRERLPRRTAPAEA
ncbi:MAG: hypothetical protein FVQ78_03005 [Solirubrobacterales bacterium]|nr:hypothetical protein [Solirubrobacterales bacterium]